MSVGGTARRLGALLPAWARIAWWGLVSPQTEREPLTVHQAVVFGDRGVLLAVRGDLRGWELPGGAARPGESGEAALVREVREETGLEVEIAWRVGDYVRTGFRPHTARVHACRVVGGELRPSVETPQLDWFRPERLPETLFPWYRMPLADALAGPGPAVERHEYQGLRAVLRGAAIDLRMRLFGTGRA